MLTDEEIKIIERSFGRAARNFTEQQWREIGAALPPGDKGRDRFFLMFLGTANDYWHGMASTPKPEVKLRQLDKLLKDARADLKKRRRLAPKRAELLFNLGYMESKYPGTLIEGAYFHRQSFLHMSCGCWQMCGGELRFSRDKTSQKPTGPLIDYLSLVCNLVMGTEAPALETLATFVQRRRRRQRELV